MKTTTKLLIAGIAVLLAIGGYLVYANDQNDQSPEQTQPTTQDQDSNEAADNTAPDSSQDNQENGGTDQEGEQSSINVTITTLDQTNSEVNVRTVVEGATAGTCTVTFSKSGQFDVRREAKLVLVTSYYTCQGWDIAKSALPAKGTWQVTVKVSSGNQEGSSSSQTININ